MKISSAYIFKKGLYVTVEGTIYELENLLHATENKRVIRSDDKDSLLIKIDINHIHMYMEVVKEKKD